MRTTGTQATAWGAQTACVLLAAALLLMPMAQPASAQVFQTPDAFLAESFAGTVPKPELLTVSPAMTREIGRILRRTFRAQQVRYWREGPRTAWILEEIGRDRPITVGVAVSEGAIEALSVLIYRESRGWEVRHDFFTNQFKGLTLDGQNNLSARIDGISGATLSVNALRTVARFALYLDKAVRAPG